MTKYIPHEPTPKQQAFLLLPHREAFYGGAAGGGKSEALLMAALQYVDVPGYAALLLRKTYQDLMLPNALMDRSEQWLGTTDAQWASVQHQWLFPSGATLTFGYLDAPRSQRRYQSAEFQFIGFDELTQFTEHQYRYLFSRLRRLENADVPLRMRSAGNPGDIGHEWVKARFVKPGSPGRPFIAATLADNPFIDREAYEASLALLTPVERSWYQYGNWDARPGGTIARREWFPIVDTAPSEARRVRYWDFAATSKEWRGDADYTVGTRMAAADGIWYVENVVRGRFGPGEVERIVRQTAEMDGHNVAICMEQEPGSSGRLFTAAMIRALAGWNIKAVPSSGDKVQRAMPFIAQAEAGNVRLVAGNWNTDWLDEITMMPDAAHDDQWDSAAGAFNALTLGDVREYQETINLADRVAISPY